jgi:hypothetical protein
MNEKVIYYSLRIKSEVKISNYSLRLKLILFTQFLNHYFFITVASFTSKICQEQVMDELYIWQSEAYQIVTSLDKS